MKNNESVNEAKAEKVGYWPAHTPFSGLIDFSVRGSSNPNFEPSSADDHVAQAYDLVDFDTYKFLWGRKEAEGTKVNMILHELGNRISKDHDLRAAETLYAIATRASFEVLSLYLRDREVFDRIAPHRRILPSLFSIHPGTSAVVRQMRLDSRLGTKTGDARLSGAKSYFVSDATANIYARAIIHSVEMNRNLDSVEFQQARWKDFERKEGLRTIVLPLPKYISGIEAIPVPIRPDTVMQYWRKGKEIILEEMPDFHLRPEWKKYCNERKYANGAKKGAVQHAIFKDILVGLKTIVGANKRLSTAPVTVDDEAS